MRPTVHDLADAAGVSLATVDRVLNRRPGVREATRLKVEEAIDRIGFVRDMAAANLAKGRIYPLVFVVPDSDNSFMAELRRQIAEAARRSTLERTSLTILTVPAFDAAALAATLETLSAEPPAGIAVVAVDAPPVRAALAALRQKGTAIVTLVSDIAGPLRDHFAGVDNLAAGRTAGSLMGRFLAERSGKVGVIAGSMLLRDHKDRLDGFRLRLAEQAPELDLLPAAESHDHPDAVERIARGLLAEHGDLVGLYHLGAGNRGLVRALAERPDAARPVVIAHELTETTSAALRSDLIDVILNQDAGHEVRSAIRVLKAQADGVGVVDAQERIRIDIFLKDNLP